MAYNPYSDLKKIYNYKTEYNKAKSANDTAGMQNAQDSAAMFYQNLRDNGYSAYADQMSGYTEGQARDWVNSFGAEQPTQTQKFTQPVAPAAANKANGSIYQGITPDVYNWVQGITDNKTMYDNSKFTLQDGNYQQYADLAVPLYESLRVAGRNDIADYLSGSNTPQALEYLRSIGIELDPAQQDMNAIVNNLLTQPSQSFNMSDIWQQSQPIIDYISQATKPDAQTQAANQQAMNNMNALFGAVMGNNQQIQQDSAALNELIKQYMGEQSGRYDDLYNWLKNSNPYETDVAKSIMSYYNAQGGKAANEATAEGIAGNAGNIDSYAAANALRQQLDFTNAGNNAVLNQFNAQSGKMLDTLRALGVDVGDAQDRLMGILGGNQAYNAELAGQYNAGTNNALNYINNANNKRIDANTEALGKPLSLYETGMNNDANVLMQQIITGGNILSNRDTQQAAVDSSKATAEADKEKAYSEMISKIQAALIEAESNENISAEETNQKMQQAILEYEAKVYNTDVDAATRKYVSDNTFAGTTYTADKNYSADVESAQIKADADASSSKNGTTTASAGTTEPAGFDEFMDLFFMARPDILKNNSIGTEDYVDGLTIKAIANTYGWDDKKVKELEEQVTAYKDNVVAGLATDRRANGVWAMPNVTNN